jgi:hypothetical protein
MSEQPGGADESVKPSANDAPMTQEEYGSLSVEDDPGGTVNPADLAGTAKEDDEPVGYQPSASEASGDSGESSSGAGSPEGSAGEASSR